MTFEEAYDLLNACHIESVAAEMREWHPAILGQMVLAVQAAKEVRYPIPHPDYFWPLQACSEREPEPTGGCKDIRSYKGRIAGAVRRLREMALDRGSGLLHNSSGP